MKMAPGIIWGVFLILVGLAVILRVLLGIKLFGAIIALFLIFLGVSLLVNRSWLLHSRHNARNVIFDERTVEENPRDQTEYNVLFGNSVYDFTKVGFPDDRSIRIKVNTVFANTTIIIDKDKPVRIKSDAVFGSSTMPDGNTVAFGTVNYSTDSFTVAKNHLFIDAPVVFGSIRIREE